MTVDFPADFVTPQLAGKKGVYEVEVVEVKEKVLPALDDALAKAYGAESLEKLRAGVRRDLENELKFKQSKSMRNQLVRDAAGPGQFRAAGNRGGAGDAQRGLRPGAGKRQARRFARGDRAAEGADLLRRHAQRQGAREVRVPACRRSPRRKTSRFRRRKSPGAFTHLAAMYQIPPDKFLKDLQKRNGLIEIYDQIMNEKVMDILQQNAKIEDVPAGSL